MATLQDFLNTRAGRWTGRAVVVVGLLVLWLSWRSQSSSSYAGDGSQVFICAETNKTFPFKVDEHTTIPVMSPYSGRPTGYPAEACYWTADGQHKDEPTWVLLNRYRGKPDATFCPECGRLVEERNPSTGPVPPPTKSEYPAVAKSR